MIRKRTEQQKQKQIEAERRAQEATKAALEWRPKPISSTTTPDRMDITITTTPGSDGAQALQRNGKPFQRVDSEYWGNVAVKDGGAIADNSYETTFGTDAYGSKSNAKLMTVRGKDFTREKNKRKRTFNGISKNGGQINDTIKYATKFVYSDDEE